MGCHPRHSGHCRDAGEHVTWGDAGPVAFASVQCGATVRLQECLQHESDFLGKGK